MILASASSLVVGCSPSTPTPPLIPTQFSYQVRVQAKDTSEYIPNAKVTIEVSGQAPLDSMTDSNGLARIFIGSSHVGRPGFLIVEVEGYEKYTQNIDLIGATLPDVVSLERLLVTLTPTAILTKAPPAIPTATDAPAPLGILTTPSLTFTYTPTRTETPATTPTAKDISTLTPTATPFYTIEFRASKTVVDPGEWVTFRWCVKNVQAVYLDWKGGVGAPGEGWDSRQMWETTDPDHTLRVVLKNGETVTRTITIAVR
jgi:hypothetical protein